MKRFFIDLMSSDERNKPSITVPLLVLCVGFSLWIAYYHGDVPNGLLYLDFGLLSSVVGINFLGETKEVFVERERTKVKVSSSKSGEKVENEYPKV